MWNQYLLPDSLSAALHLIDTFGPEARIVAGGTDLVLALQEGKLPPVEALIDVSRLPELQTISVREGWVEIGAGTVLTELVRSTCIRQFAPILADAARQIAGWQIRNLATVGGNVINASPAADLVPPLLTLDAEVCTACSANGGRSVPLEQFLLGPRRVDLRPGELVTAIRFPVPAPGELHVFRKVQPRRSMAIAMLNLAILGWIEGETLREVRVAMGAVAPTAVRLRAVEQKLTGLDLGTAGNAELYLDVEQEIAPISDFRASRNYRLKVARNLLHEQVQELIQSYRKRTGEK